MGNQTITYIAQLLTQEKREIKQCAQLPNLSHCVGYFKIVTLVYGITCMPYGQRYLNTKEWLREGCHCFYFPLALVCDRAIKYLSTQTVTSC